MSRSEWLDVGEKYDYRSIMHYSGIVSRSEEIYSMTKVVNGEDTGEPVDTSFKSVLVIENEVLTIKVKKNFRKHIDQAHMI